VPFQDAGSLGEASLLPVAEGFGVAALHADRDAVDVAGGEEGVGFGDERSSQAAAPGVGHDVELVDPARGGCFVRPTGRLDLGEEEAEPLAPALGDQEPAALPLGAAPDLARQNLAQAGRRREARREAAVVLDQVEPEREDRGVIVGARAADRDLAYGWLGYFTTRCSLARIIRRLPDFSPSDQVPVSSPGDGWSVIR
jgi:hypothetical protein